MEISLPHMWEPRDYQYKLWNYLHTDLNGALLPGLVAQGKRACVVWHRRAGKDLFSINFIAEQMMARRGTYWHCLPTYAQGRKIVWDEIIRFRNPFPKELVAASHDKDMQVIFKDDAEGPGSVFQVVGTDKIDRLVGGNPVGIVFSEYSLANPAAWNLLQPVLRENGGWAIFIYTPRGHNHGYTMAQRALKSSVENKRWFFQQLTVLDTIHNGQRVVSDEDIDLDREDGMPEELVKQEYFGSWDAPLVGAYYSKEMMELEKAKQIGNVPYEKRLPVDTYWDLGVDDQTTIWFIQKYGLEYRVIDYYSAQGEGLPHYAKVLGKKPYVYGKHHAPHDIMVRELNNGKSRYETARSLGIKFRVAKKLPVVDGIEAVRNVLNKCYFDQTRCRHGIDALSSYQKTYDEDKEIYSSTPLHNWASHGADAFRTFAQFEKPSKKQETEGKAGGRGKRKSSTDSGVSEYDPLSH